MQGSADSGALLGSHWESGRTGVEQEVSDEGRKGPRPAQLWLALEAMAGQLCEACSPFGGQIPGSEVTV